MVEWKEFIAALNKLVPIDEESAKQFQYILGKKRTFITIKDNSNTGYVSAYKFADFLSGFGPLKQCVSKVHSVVNAE